MSSRPRTIGGYFAFALYYAGFSGFAGVGLAAAPEARGAGYVVFLHEEHGLRMTPAVACKSIAGYEAYEPLPGAELTSDEKLLVYYRPLGYRVERSGSSYKLHLTQDARIRRRESKPVLLSKNKLLDYEPTTEEPPGPIFLRNSISLKGLKPGEYDLDIVLRDELVKGSVTIQTLKFRVIPAHAGSARPERR